MKILLLYGILILISACSSPNFKTEYSLNEKVDKMMEKSSKRCLNKGFHGHEPEYRDCVLRNITNLLGMSATRI